MFYQIYMESNLFLLDLKCYTTDGIKWQVFAFCLLLVLDGVFAFSYDQMLNNTLGTCLLPNMVYEI